MQHPSLRKGRTWPNILPAPHLKAVDYRSFDLDGCVFHGYSKYRESGDIIQDNAPLWQHVKIDSQQAERIICLVGSNRQSHWLDKHNRASCNTPSLTTALDEITRHLHSTVENIPCLADTYLLADTFSEQPHGSSFRAIREYRHKRHPHNKTFFDHSKINIIYAQTHRAALTHPNASITFTLYDDTRHILNGLTAFYTQHPQLLPHNVTLKLRRYTGHSIKIVHDIKGTGPIDSYYEASIRHLKLLSTSCKDQRSSHVKKQWVTPGKIKTFESARNARLDHTPIEQPSAPPSPSCFAPAVRFFQRVFNISQSLPSDAADTHRPCNP